jgi:Putative peptidoglycan binding domain
MNETTTPTAENADVRRNRSKIVAATSALVAVGAGAALIFAFAGPASAHKPTPTPAPAQHTVTPANHGTVTPDNHRTKPAPTPSNVTPPSLPNQELPASQVRTIQTELGQLNYYEGSVNGVMTAQTVQAIKYLQRDAQLPQTGYYDQITYLALQHMLATGNNQMAG